MALGLPPRGKSPRPPTPSGLRGASASNARPAAWLDQADTCPAYAWASCPRIGRTARPQLPSTSSGLPRRSTSQLIRCVTIGATASWIFPSRPGTATIRSYCGTNFHRLPSRCITPQPRWTRSGQARKSSTAIAHPSSSRLRTRTSDRALVDSITSPVRCSMGVSEYIGSPTRPKAAGASRCRHRSVDGARSATVWSGCPPGSGGARRSRRVRHPGARTAAAVAGHTRPDGRAVAGGRGGRTSRAAPGRRPGGGRARPPRPSAPPGSPR